METISFWFFFGVEHILSLTGIDHLLFLLSLCVSISDKGTRALLLTITAFTLGHTCTLILTTYNIIHLNNQLIEILIPITILCSGILSFNNKNNQSITLSFLLAFLFGLIHGCGFSNTLKALLGKEESVLFPLLFFNVGVEAGQLILVVIYFLVFNWLSFGLRQNLNKKILFITILGACIILINRIIDL